VGVPTITSTFPLNNDIDISIDVLILITFSEAVDRDSVTTGTIVLTDTETLETLDGYITFTSSDTIVRFLPNSALRQNKLYKLTIVGSDQALPSGYVTSESTSAALTTTSTIKFRTKIERYVSLEEVTDRDDIDHVAPIREASDLGSSTGVINITATSPTGFSTNNREVSTITVTFSEYLDTTVFDSTTMFSLEMVPVLDLDRYYGNKDSSTIKKLYTEDDTIPIALPSGDIVASTNRITWTRITPTLGADDHPRLNYFPYNAEVIVTLDSTLTGISGRTLGEDVKFCFTTEFFPMFSGSNTIRLDVGSVIDDIYDDTLNRIVLKRSIEGWELLAGRNFSLVRPSMLAIEYARYGSILDVLEVIGVKADIQRGVRKQLGDFSVDYTRRAASEETGRFSTIRGRFERAEFALRMSADALRTRTANLGSSASSGQVIFRGLRNWDTIFTTNPMDPNAPAANTGMQREIQKAVDQGARACAYVGRDPVDNGYIYIYGY
jgi:hypothetical protein